MKAASNSDVQGVALKWLHFMKLKLMEIFEFSFVRS